MIGYLQGKVLSVDENQVLLSVNGVGFEVFTSIQNLNAVKIGDVAEFFTYLAVREDGLYLYGFKTTDEKRMFLQLITVSGIGPKVALSILSGMDIGTLAMTIINEDSKALSKIKGIGKKTAERIILELKESVTPPDADDKLGFVPRAERRDTLDAIMALRSLGISEKDAVRAVKAVEDNAKNIEELITLALKALG